MIEFWQIFVSESLWQNWDTFKTVFWHIFVTDSFLTDIRQIYDKFMNFLGPTFWLSTIILPPPNILPLAGILRSQLIIFTCGAAVEDVRSRQVYQSSVVFFLLLSFCSNSDCTMHLKLAFRGQSQRCLFASTHNTEVHKILIQNMTHESWFRNCDSFHKAISNLNSISSTSKTLKNSHNLNPRSGFIHSLHQIHRPVGLWPSCLLAMAQNSIKAAGSIRSQPCYYLTGILWCKIDNCLKVFSHFNWVQKIFILVIQFAVVIILEWTSFNKGNFSMRRRKNTTDDW